MKLGEKRIIEINEYEEKYFLKDEISELVGIDLYKKYKNHLEVDFPTYRTGNRWRLKAKGWVGYIPITSNISLKLNPKIPIKNIFGMLEYAYTLKSFKFLEGIINCDSIEDFYSQLAYLFCQKVLERCRRGLYKNYLHKSEQLTYLRGRLDIEETIRNPWNVKFKCHYEEHTTNVIENQILLWTVYIIGRSGLCSEKVSLTVRRAFHALQGFVTLQICSSKDCIEINYNRLNQDYELLHNLSRLFLDNSVPTHEKGEYISLPFLVDMARLYELFIAEWLKVNLPKNLMLRYQERIDIAKNLYFKTDLVVYDSLTSVPRFIIDTKYKNTASVSSDDVAQVIAYAVSKNCKEAILLYPTPLKQPLNKYVGDIRVRSLTFSLNDDFEYAGNTFLHELFSEHIE